MTQSILTTLVVVEGLIVILLAWHNHYLSSTLAMCLDVMDGRKIKVDDERLGVRSPLNFVDQFYGKE